VSEGGREGGREGGELGWPSSWLVPDAGGYQGWGKEGGLQWRGETRRYLSLRYR